MKILISSVYRIPDLILLSCLEYEQTEKMSTHIFVLFLAVLCTGIKADSSFFNCTSMLPFDKDADCNKDPSTAPINFVVRNSAGTPVMTFSAGDTLTS